MLDQRRALVPAVPAHISGIEFCEALKFNVSPPKRVDWAVDLHTQVVRMVHIRLASIPSASLLACLLPDKAAH